MVFQKISMGSPAKKPTKGAKYHVRKVGTMNTVCGRHAYDVDFVKLPVWFVAHPYPDAIEPHICKSCKRLKPKNTEHR